MYLAYFHVLDLVSFHGYLGHLVLFFDQIEVKLAEKKFCFFFEPDFLDMHMR